MTQAMRDRVMNKFRRSEIEFLVATDVAARGIDVENIEVVFNYDLPYDAEDYVHRIGRTGRQGRSGRAISFVSGREVFQIRNFERYVNARIYRADAPTVDEVEEARANTVLDKVRATLKGGDYKRQEPLIGRLLEEGFSSTDIASALLHQLQGEDSAMVAKAPREAAGRGRESRSSESSRPRSQTAFTPHSGAGGTARPQAARPRYEKPVNALRDRRNTPEMERPPRNRDERPPQKERAPAPHQPAIPTPGVVAEKSVPAKLVREQSVPHKAEISKPGPASEKPVAPKSAREQPAPHQTEIPAARPVIEKPVAKPVREQSASHQADIPKTGPVGEKRIPAKSAREETAPHRTAIPESGSAVEKRVPARPAPEQTAPHQTEIPERPEPGAHHPPKASRRTPDGQTRLFMNVGAEMGVSEADVVGVILGETGLPRKTVGAVDVRERHLFVDVASEHANGIIAKLNRAQIKGRKAKVKVA
jgi:hypothetical protein